MISVANSIKIKIVIARFYGSESAAEGSVFTFKRIGSPREAGYTTGLENA